MPCSANPNISRGTLRWDMGLATSALGPGSARLKTVEIGGPSRVDYTSNLRLRPLYLCQALIQPYGLTRRNEVWRNHAAEICWPS